MLLDERIQYWLCLAESDAVSAAAFHRVGQELQAIFFLRRALVKNLEGSRYKANCRYSSRDSQCGQTGGFVRAWAETTGRPASFGRLRAFLYNARMALPSRGALSCALQGARTTEPVPRSGSLADGGPWLIE